MFILQTCNEGCKISVANKKSARIIFVHSEMVEVVYVKINTHLQVTRQINLMK